MALINAEPRQPYVEDDATKKKWQKLAKRARKLPIKQSLRVPGKIINVRGPVPLKKKFKNDEGQWVEQEVKSIVFKAETTEKGIEGLRFQVDMRNSRRPNSNLGQLWPVFEGYVPDDTSVMDTENWEEKPCILVLQYGGEKKPRLNEETNEYEPDTTRGGIYLNLTNFEALISDDDEEDDTDENTNQENPTSNVVDEAIEVGAALPWENN